MTNQHIDYDEPTHGWAMFFCFTFYLPAYIYMVS